MAKGFKHGAGGGTPLNFKVVGGTTEPASPKENTIWVNTSTAITSWIFSASEPENPTEGMAWFTTGASSPTAFNALKKNGIQVYPLSVKQYVSGAWVDLEGKSYQNGEWVDWCTYLFMGGNQYTQLTGGWKIDRNGGINVTIGQTIDFEIIMASARDAAVFTNNKVDLTNFKTLEFVVNVTSVGNVHVGITTNNSGSVPTFTAKKTITTTGQHIATVDLKSIYGEYYVGIHCDAASAKFSQVRLI